MGDVHDLNDMMVFLAVVEAGSFTIAAERLGIPKANVSRKVSRLEQQVGVTLLERSTRSQHLTEAGRHYLHHCKRIQEEVDLADAAISQILDMPKGPIKIGASVTVGQQVLKPALSDFMQHYPDINVQLSLVNRRVDLIEEGFDLLIRVGELNDSRLIAKRLGSAERKLYVSPQYVKQHGAIDAIEALCDCHFLLMSTVHKSEKIILESGRKKRDLTVAPRLAVDDFLILKQAVVDNLGVAILPDYLCKDEVARGELINILPDWGMPAVDIYALYPPHRAKIPKIKAFIDFAADAFKQRLIHQA